MYKRMNFVADSSLHTNYRCTICNTVNNAEIASNPDELREGTRFYPDPSNDHFWICQECHDAINGEDEFLDEDDYLYDDE